MVVVVVVVVVGRRRRRRRRDSAVGNLLGLLLRGLWAALARFGVGLCVDYGLLLRGSGLVCARIMGCSWRGVGLDRAWVYSSKVQKNAKKVQKNAKIFAYMEYFLYLCIGFGNSPVRNYLTL